MSGFFDLLYAAKAWAAGVVVAVGQVVAAVQLAVADEAISFDEAQGIWLLVTEAATVVFTAVAVFRTRNARAPAGG